MESLPQVLTCTKPIIWYRVMAAKVSVKTAKKRPVPTNKKFARVKAEAKRKFKVYPRLMQTDGLLKHTRSQRRLVTAWGNSMEFIIGLRGAVCHWAWGKWGPGKL